MWNMKSCREIRIFKPFLCEMAILHWIVERESTKRCLLIFKRHQVNAKNLQIHKCLGINCKDFGICTRWIFLYLVITSVDHIGISEFSGYILLPSKCGISLLWSLSFNGKGDKKSLGEGKSWIHFLSGEFVFCRFLREQSGYSLNFNILI